MSKPTRSDRAGAIPGRASVRAAGWPLERALFALAGSLTLVAAVLGAFKSRWFLLLAALVGVNQWLYVLVGACPSSWAIGRLAGLRSALYAPEDRSTP